MKRKKEKTWTSRLGHLLFCVKLKNFHQLANLRFLHHKSQVMSPKLSLKTNIALNYYEKSTQTSQQQSTIQNFNTAS